jgi:hypothetical protein
MKKALRGCARLSLVAGTVLLSAAGGLASPKGDALLPETRTRSARIGFFLTLGLHELAHDARAIKNPAKFFAGFLVVDYMTQISNFSLLKDFLKIMELYSEKEV